MSEKLTTNRLDRVLPSNPFLLLSKEYGKDPEETALEAPIFDFALTEHQMGARIVQIPPDRAFQEHIHPHAYHFILVLKGLAVLVYDGERHELQPGECCLVRKGVWHNLGAGPDGLTALVVNTPTYENGDPRHVEYRGLETLASVELPVEPSDSPEKMPVRD